MPETRELTHAERQEHPNVICENGVALESHVMEGWVVYRAVPRVQSISTDIVRMVDAEGTFLWKRLRGRG